MAEKIAKGTPIYMIAILIVCILLVVVGFVMPPVGEIHGSVLTAIGELGGLGIITDFVTKLPAIIRAGGKATIQHGDTTIEVGARKKDFGGIDADSGQLTLEGAGDRIVWQGGQIARIDAEHGKRCADVGFPSTVCCFQLSGKNLR